MEGSGIGQFIPLILIFVIFYFFLIRPQQKKVKEHKAMVESLKKGDKIVTSGGITGVITRVIDNDKLEEVSKNIFVLYDQEINWRKKFKINVMNKINKHDDIIKNTIGLRLQERLTKEQAKLVASCISVHRDISLNFW